jgi:hypothetical protein
MQRNIAASCIVVLHSVFIGFAALGAPLVLRFPILFWPHALATAWILAHHFLAVPCPLTLWEKQVRTRRGEPIYDGGCIEHYILRGRPAHRGLTALGTIVVVANLATYLWLWIH